jgi:hypothetical protein
LAIEDVRHPDLTNVAEHMEDLGLGNADISRSSREAAGASSGWL